MMQPFRAPIPGQSLTTPPKNMPYERPPEITDPEEALQEHLLRLTDPDKMEATLTLLESGVDLVTLTEGIVRNGVMNGIHSIDISLIVAPAIHEFIKSYADELGIQYEEGFENQAEKKRFKKAKINSLVKQKLSEKPKPEIKEKEETQIRPKKGLMSRKGN